MKPFYFILILVFAGFRISQSQCPSHQSEVIVSIQPDQYPEETTWDIKDVQGNIIRSGGIAGDTFCVSSSMCLKFTIYDIFGDGICCKYGIGSYELYFDGDLVTSGGQFGYSEAHIFNCEPGYSCFEPVTVTEGTYTADFNNFWYAFTPASTGIYTISTCNVNTCDTKIWLYDYCSANLTSQANDGTIYYDDNAGGCGIQANVTAYLEQNKTYYIRMGSNNNSCSQPITWQLSFGGDITGCMNPEACNYNPFANVDDGSCIFDGHPDCTAGPDLVVLENVLRTSIYADVIFNNTDNCLINEGCLQGFGKRQIVRFTTHIKNIGETDYYIGAPSGGTDQFSFDNCHGHYHYEGYAEYRLANAENELLPIGFKNGFCVLDLECSDGGSPKFGCGNMGISAQCGDYYDSGLECQWIDVTDLPAGDYTLVVTVNWDQSADAFGNFEMDYANNWAQVCFRLNRDAGNNHSITILSECEAYVDCEGVPYGNAQLDCLGNCNGTSLFGDLDANGTQNTLDAQEYIDNIIDGGMDAASCFDLFADDVITVYDAALLNSCVIYGINHNHPNDGNIHDHCNLPGGVTNPTHTVEFTILEVDFTNKTIDIGMNNPLDHVVAYEFNLSGVAIENVENLVNVNDYPVQPDFFPGGQKVISMSLVDSAINKSNIGFQPICRVHYSELTGEEICIDEVIDVVNDEYYKVNDSIVDGCVEILTGLRPSNNIRKMNVYPNPNNGIFKIAYELKQIDHFSLVITNHLGQIVFQKAIENAVNGEISVDLANEPSGIYHVLLNSKKGSAFQKVVINR
jgi:hypothetical protein